MSNLEHLVDNGLYALKNCDGYDEWLKQMRKDPNWEGVERLTIDDLWEICQYVFYVWTADDEDEPQIDIHDLTDCDFCKDRNCKDCEGGKDEPQTEVSAQEYERWLFKEPQIEREGE